jgi:hypothetical protein
MEHNITVSLDKNDGFSSFLKNMVREYNNQQSIHHKCKKRRFSSSHKCDGIR